MIQYKIRNDRLFHQDIGTYQSYGIDVFEDNVLINSILDVTHEQQKMESLIALMNELNLDLIHLNDVIEDFLV